MMMLIVTFLIRVPKGYTDSGLHAQWMRVRTKETAVAEVREAVAKMNDAILVLASIHVCEVKEN